MGGRLSRRTHQVSLAYTRQLEPYNAITVLSGVVVILYLHNIAPSWPDGGI